MKKRRTTIIVISVVLLVAFAGLLLLQVHFLSIAETQKEELFRRNVLNAMERTSKQLEAKDTESMIYNIAFKMQMQPNAERKPRTVKPDSIATMQKREQQMRPKQAKPIEKSADSVTSSFNGIVITVDDDGTTRTIARGGKFTSAISATVGTSSSFAYTTDSTLFTFSTPFDTGRTMHYLKKLPEVKKTILVTNVLKQLTAGETTPIAKRIKISLLDSLLKVQLANSGITTPFTFGLLSGHGSAIAPVHAERDSAQLLRSEFRVPLFPEVVLPIRSYIALYFPDKKSFIRREMLPLYGTAAFLSCIILFSFIYVFRTILRQHKLSVQLTGFINNMTHEFKTPISSIALASEAIARSEVIQDPEKHNRYNQVIKDEVHRMKLQVEKILQVAVLEEGDFALHTEPADVVALLYKTVESFQLRAESLHGSITVDASLMPSCIIQADTLHLSNVFANILDNSLKYIKGAPRITIQVQQHNGAVQLQFTDNGLGIPQSDLKHVFEKYYRVPTGNLHAVKGFGLGLSYVHRITALHKGSVSISSRIGEGTTLSLLIPVEEYEK